MADHHGTGAHETIAASLAALPLSELERTLLTAFGSRQGLHRLVPRLVPAFLILTLGVWLFAPTTVVLRVTPWVGAMTLMGAGIYLARIIMVTGRVTLGQAVRRAAVDQRTLRRLRRGVVQAMAMAAGTVVLGAAFLVVSLQLLGDGAPAAYAGLLWALCLGGFLLSLFVGEMVMRLADTVDANEGVGGTR